MLEDRFMENEWSGMQSVVALSSVESDLFGLANCVAETLGADFSTSASVLAVLSRAMHRPPGGLSSGKDSESSNTSTHRSSTHCQSMWKELRFERIAGDFAPQRYLHQGSRQP